MLTKKKSNLSKSKKNRKNKEVNDSQSEEQYIKKLEVQRIAKAKYLQKESFEKKKERLFHYYSTDSKNMKYNSSLQSLKLQIIIGRFSVNRHLEF